MTNVDWLRGDLGFDAPCFKDELKDQALGTCTAGPRYRNRTMKYDECRYKRQNHIEIMFGRLRDGRRVATRCG